MKRYGLLIILGLGAIASIVVDIILKLDCTIFNILSEMLFSLVTVIAGFWVTCYLLILEIFKDRYPIKLIKDKYLPQMKSIIVYVVYVILFGCIILIKQDGLIENIWFAISALFITFIILKYVYDASKTIMVNTHVNEYCTEILNKLQNKENGVKKDAFKELRYILDECIVKEEYYIVQNISMRLGDIFREFMRNAIGLTESGEAKSEVEDSFERIVRIGAYQLLLCKDINSKLLITEITTQQTDNVFFCIKNEQYEWFKIYIENLNELLYKEQKAGEYKVVEEIFDIYIDVIERLIEEEKIEWVKYMIDNLFAITTSINFVSNNINLKYFASLIVYGLIKCREEKIYEYLYEVFERFTCVANRVSDGFSHMKVYYALYFNKLISENNKKYIEYYLDTLFRYGQGSGRDTIWTEFKFYCINEVLENKEHKLEIDINEYHNKILVEVIEMKEPYRGYMFFPDYKKGFEEAKTTPEKCEIICKSIRYLFNKCIVNDNLSMFFTLLKEVSDCMINTKAQNKALQIVLFDLYIWLVNRTHRIINKQFLEITFMELERVIKDLDKEKAISHDFGDSIITKLSELARKADSDGNIVILEIVGLFSGFLDENKELHFIHSNPERKGKLYKGVFNIATICIENDFEEGVRRCSNAIGWFTIYSIKQSNGELTKYLIKLAKGMLEISKEMNVSKQTQIFILTLFTTVGMYCCQDSANYLFVDIIIDAIHKVDKEMVYTAIKLRTYENDMWDELLNGNIPRYTNLFKKRYDSYQKR